MQYSAEKIAQVKEHVRHEPFALAYIEELEERLQQAQVNQAKAIAEQVITNATNTMYGANLNELFRLFRELPGASEYVLALYADGSGAIQLTPYDEILCSWDDLRSAKSAIEQTFHNDGKENADV